ncbi:MAG: hypothetical protein Q8867_07490 [Bacteroidota bacterium]|nr:hypothetical protein [Bacteroidota bacterium]
MSKGDRDAFSSSVKLIKVWTYAVGDSAFRYYEQAWNEARDILASRGYQTEQIFYKSYLNVSPDQWKEDVVRKLGPGEAFLDLSTVLFMDTTGTHFHGSRVITFVVDESGKIFAGVNQQMNGKMPRTFMSLAQARLYANFPGSTAPVHDKIFEKKDSVMENALDKVVRSVMERIPYSKQESMKGSLAYNNHIEFQCNGGYVSGGSVNVTNGKVDYKSGNQFGFNLGFTVYRSIDFILSFNRTESKLNIYSPLYRGKDDPFSLNINYYYFGVCKNFYLSKVFCPFLTAYLGGVNNVPGNKDFRDTWYFALQAQAGIKIYMTRFFGLVLQGNSFLQVHPKGAPFIYDNARTIVDADSELSQYGFSGGIFFNIRR